MKITGRIEAKGKTIKFHDASGVIAKLVYLSLYDGYQLNIAGSDRTLSLETVGLFTKKLAISDVKNNLKWIYKPRKWYDKFMDRRCLYAGQNEFDVFVSDDTKLESYFGDRKIGTIRLEYGEGRSDPNEYHASFADDIDPFLVMVMTSIFHIQIEDWKPRDW